MFVAKVCLGTLAPGAHEPVIEASADGGTHKRNHASSPFFNDICTGAGRNALNHSRNELVYHFLFEKFAADVDTRRAGRSDPELGDFVIRVELKAIDEAKLLDGAHGDGRENTEIRDDGDQTSQAETRALSGRQLHSAANDVICDGVKLADFQRIDAVVGADGHTVGRAQLQKKSSGIDLNP